MYSYHYICTNDECKYSHIFENIGCIQGDINELIKQVKNNPNFCRDQVSINYEYFLDSINNHTVIYITDDTDNIVGCSSICVSESFIILYGIGVPISCVKNRGTILIKKIKELGYELKCNSIILSTSENVQLFYEKNDFIVIQDKNRNKYDFISMIFFILH